jgi:hypothetical protein
MLRTVAALAGYLVTTMALSSGTGAAIAADMPSKAPEAPAYQWSGCYVGLNLGGGASGPNFTSTIDPGTHLLGADPALVAADGSGGANQDGVLAGGQAVPLSKIHHAAFDAHLIGIDPDYRLHVSERLLGQNDGPMLEALKRLNGGTIHLPGRVKDQPDRDRLALRFERFKAVG